MARFGDGFDCPDLARVPTSAEHPLRGGGKRPAEEKVKNDEKMSIHSKNRG